MSQNTTHSMALKTPKCGWCRRAISNGNPGLLDGGAKTLDVMLKRSSESHTRLRAAATATAG